MSTRQRRRGKVEEYRNQTKQGMIIEYRRADKTKIRERKLSKGRMEEQEGGRE